MFCHFWLVEGHVSLPAVASVFHQPIASSNARRPVATMESASSEHGLVEKMRHQTGWHMIWQFWIYVYDAVLPFRQYWCHCVCQNNLNSWYNHICIERERESERHIRMQADKGLIGWRSYIQYVHIYTCRPRCLPPTRWYTRPLKSPRSHRKSQVQVSSINLNQKDNWIFTCQWNLDPKYKVDSLEH